jgi:hypothetical protein
MRDAIRDDRGRRSGRLGRLDRPRSCIQQLFVIVIEGREVDADGGAGVSRRDDASVLEARPAELEHNPLLRVHELRGRRREPEEGCIEGVHLVDATRPTRLALVAVLERISPVVTPIPAFERNFPDGAATAQEEVPKLFRGVAAGQATREADDRDVASRAAFHREPRLLLSGAGCVMGRVHPLRVRRVRRSWRGGVPPDR